MIAGLVLAAGSSTRMGRPKQLIEYRGKTLLERSLEAAIGGGCDPLIAVLGAHAEAVRNGVGNRRVECVVNEDWRAGMSASIRIGVEALAGRDVSAALLLPCDQPRLEAAVVRRVLGAFDGRPGRIVACEYAGTIGIPVLFECSRFAELTLLSGDRGAREILNRHPQEVVRVAWPAGAHDIDRPEDLHAREPDWH